MTKTKEHRVAVKDDSKDRFSSELKTLKGSVAQLRDDVTTVLDNTWGAGKSGAGMIKDRASTAVVDFKDRSLDSVERLGQKIGERPLLSAAIAVGIGYILGKLFSTKR